MTANRDGQQRGFWRRHRIKLLAVAVVIVLAWLAYYLENIPVARDFGSEDAKLTVVADDQAARIGGVADGPVGSVRLVAARRLKVTIPGRSTMVSPELGPFEAKAAADKATLAGLTCGSDYSLLDAHAGIGETATVALSLSSNSPNEERALLIGRADPSQFDKNSLMLRAEGAKLNLVVDFQSSGEGAKQGLMTLCRSGASASLGHAEFAVPAGAPVVFEFQEIDPAAGAVPGAAFDLPHALAVSSVALARFEADGPFEPERIACGAQRAGDMHWNAVMPRVDLSNCRPRSLLVTEFDVASGKVTISKRPAFFRNFDPASDVAHFVSRALKNPVVQQLLVGGILSGIVVPWVIAQFRKSKKPKPPRRRPKPRPRA
jgi:hypothetical protein